MKTLFKNLHFLLAVCVIWGGGAVWADDYYWYGTDTEGVNTYWNAQSWSNDGGTTLVTIYNNADIDPTTVTAYITNGGTVNASNTTYGYFNVGAIVVGDGDPDSTTISTLTGFSHPDYTPKRQTITLLQNGVFTCTGDGGATDTSFIVNGGTLNYTHETRTRHLNLRTSASELNTGTINAQIFTVGAGSDGTASYKQTGGNMTTTGAFTLAGGNTNSVTLSGGTFNVSTFTKSTTDSSFTFSGGTLQTNSITLATGDTLNQQGGTLVTGYGGLGNLAITGNYTLNTGATLKLTGSFTVSGTATLNGEIDASAFNAIPRETGAVVNLMTAGTLAGTYTVTGLSTDWTTSRTDDKSLVGTYSGPDTVNLYWENNATENPYTNAANWKFSNNDYLTVGLGDDPYASMRHLHVEATPTNGVNLGDGTGNTKILGGTLTVGNGNAASTVTAYVYRPGQIDLFGTLNVNTNGTFRTTSGAINIGTGDGAGVAVVNGGTLISAGNLNVGANATTGADSSLTIKDGTVTASAQLNVNNGSTLNLEGGSLAATGTTGNNHLTVTSEMNVSGGTLTTSNRLQMNNGGVLNITGGEINANGAFYTGLDRGVGTVNQSSGTVSVVGQFAIGWGNGKGIYNLSGGTLTTTGDASVWGQSSSTSEFNMTGGTANFNGNYIYTPLNGTALTGTSFVIGAHSNTTLDGSATKFDLHAGTVTTTGNVYTDRGSTLNISKDDDNSKGDGVMNIGGALRLAGASTVNLSSGTLSATNGMEIGFTGGSSTFNMTGGTANLNSLNVKNGSTVNLSGSGELNVTLNMLLGYGSAGTFNMSGGTANLKLLRVGDYTVGVNATLTVSGGTMNITDDLQTSLNAPSTVTISETTSDVPTVVNAGRVLLGASGTDATTFTLSGGTLNIGAGGIITDASYTGTYTLNLNGGTLGTLVDGETSVPASWASDLNANIAAGSTITFAPVGDIYWAGNLSGDGGLTKSGTGMLRLSGANKTYTGPTTVSAGTLQLMSANASKISIAEGATLDLTAAPYGAAYTITSSAGTITGTSTLNTQLEFEVSAGMTETLNTPITGISTFNKMGEGTLNMNYDSANPLAIPTITQLDGRLNMKGSYTGNININNGIFSPGNSIGTTNLDGNYVLGSTGALLLEIGEVSGAFGTDVLNVTGTLSLNGTSSISFDWDDFLPTSDGSFTLLSAGNIEGYNGIAWNEILDNAGMDTNVWSVTAGAKSVVLNYGNPVPPPSDVPEPSTWIMMVLGLLGVGYYRSRGMKK
ncbi:MAG: autotransporter-associated beta strand repeat-containing protein [Planctomycetia bacterium]|nr:autotransporter-associated beta strand repeat-containing protein [Planctomycetia bacterium]